MQRKKISYLPSLNEYYGSSNPSKFYVLLAQTFYQLVANWTRESRKD